MGGSQDPPVGAGLGPAPDSSEPEAAPPPASAAAAGSAESPKPARPRYWQVAPVGTSLIVLLVLIHLGVELAGGSESWRLFRLGANFQLATVSGEPWRLLTSMFLHGGLLHLGVNAYALYALGRLVEQLYGSLRFWIIYLAAGLAGSAASALFGEAARLSVGASGAIFGLLGAALALMLRLRRVLPPGWRKQVTINLLFVLGLNLYIGMRLTMVDNAAHIGGVIGGGLVGLLLPLGPLALIGRWRRRIVLALAGSGLLAALSSAVMVALTPAATTLATLPRKTAAQGGVQVRCPGYWLQLSAKRLELRDPLPRLLLAEFDALPIRDTGQEAKLQKELLAAFVEQLRQQPEIRQVQLLEAPSLMLAAPEVQLAEVRLTLFEQPFSQLVMLRRQGALVLTGRVLLPVRRLQDYAQVLAELARSLRYQAAEGAKR